MNTTTDPELFRVERCAPDRLAQARKRLAKAQEEYDALTSPTGFSAYRDGHMEAKVELSLCKAELAAAEAEEVARRRE